MSFEHSISFNCIKVLQPIGEFYIGTINSKDLIEISYTDVRRIEKIERDVESYLGIQRPLSEPRVKELKQYVNTIDATFPTSIIIAISSQDAIHDEDNNKMILRRDRKIAKIIDGQHRIAGLEGYLQNDFQLCVTIFVDMDIEDQAMVFATINIKQTKVSKSLAYDLYEFSKARSPQKTCHNIAKLFNNKEESPFKNKIKILGIATGKIEESITQATFVERLIVLISPNPMMDRHLLKSGKELEEADESKFIFRKMFKNDKDVEIAKNLWNYFKAVEKKWPHAWPVHQTGNILNRSTGFGALMRFLRDAYLSFNKKDQVLSTEEYYLLFKKIKLIDKDFTPANFKPGSSGESELYSILISESEIYKAG